MGLCHPGVRHMNLGGDKPAAATLPPLPILADWPALMQSWRVNSEAGS